MVMLPVFMRGKGITSDVLLSVVQRYVSQHFAIISFRRSKLRKKMLFFVTKPFCNKILISSGEKFMSVKLLSHLSK